MFLCTYAYTCFVGNSVEHDILRAALHYVLDFNVILNYTYIGDQYDIILCWVNQKCRRLVF